MRSWCRFLVMSWMISMVRLGCTLLFAVFFDSGLFFLLFLQLKSPKFFVLFIQLVDLLTIEQIPLPSFPFLLLLFPDSLLSLHLQQLSFLHLLLILVDILFLDLLVLLPDILLKLLQLLLLLFLTFLLKLFSLFYLVLHKMGSTIVSSW